jgi:hypothetical protein
MLPQSFLVA